MNKLALSGGKPASPERIQIAKPIIREEVLEEIKDIIKTGYLRQGPRVKKFEEKFAEKTGAKYAYAVNNGTAALHTAYLTVLNPGDEVIVPSFTFLATASMVHYAMGKPIFSDVDPETYLIDIEDVKEKITSKTKSIVPVHLFGNAADMSSLLELCEDNDMFLISDSAQAHGTEYNENDIGSFDDLGCYSFYPSKTLTTGEGGMVTTNNEEFYRKGTLLRAHGDDSRYHHVILGFNYRMTEIAAVLGLDQMKQFNDFLERRKECGGYLKEKISNMEVFNTQKISDKVTSSYSYFTLTIDPDLLSVNRDTVVEALKNENVESAVHYPIPLTRQPIIRKMFNPEPTPVAEELSEKIFSLPIHPKLTDDDLNNIVYALEKIASNYQKK
jgi:dTDP-4-amino-4,6-dideoxygalactose transaminase